MQLLPVLASTDLELVKAGFSVVVSLTTLAVGWLVGNRFSFAWAVRQKRRESQIEATRRFYEAYGEFFVTWKLWNRLSANDEQFANRRWELLQRISNAEASIEANQLKLVNETELSKEQIVSLACFRQGFQTLRQSIRSSDPLHWTSSNHPDYVCFKRLANQVARIMGGDWQRSTPTSESAERNLIVITSNYWESRWTTDHTKTDLTRVFQRELSHSSDSG